MKIHSLLVINKNSEQGDELLFWTFERLFKKNELFIFIVNIISIALSFSPDKILSESKVDVKHFCLQY